HDDVARFTVHSDDSHERGLWVTEAVCESHVIIRTIQCRAGVIAHPPVYAHVEPLGIAEICGVGCGVATRELHTLRGAHRVERDARLANNGPARFECEPRHGDS